VDKQGNVNFALNIKPRHFHLVLAFANFYSRSTVIKSDDLAILERALLRAQELTLEDVYEFAEGPEDEVNDTTNSNFIKSF